MSEQKNEIVVYQPDETIRLDVRLDGETVWLTQNQMVQLFMRDQSVIARHIRNIFREKEVDKESNMHFLHIPLSDKPVAFYSLDVIISVGYRVKSIVGTRFRQWANKVLKEYLLKGYAVNERLERLEQKVIKHDEQLDLVLKTALPQTQGVFFDGQVFDANVFATKHILSATKSIVLIDGWVNVVTLEMLAKKRKGVKVEVITEKRPKLLADSDIDRFNRQYGGLTVTYSKKFHDRFLIVDDKHLYLIGASLKDLGEKCFAFTKLDANEIPRIKSRISVANKE